MMLVLGGKQQSIKTKAWQVYAESGNLPVPRPIVISECERSMHERTLNLTLLKFPIIVSFASVKSMLNTERRLHVTTTPVAYLSRLPFDCATGINDKDRTRALL